MSLFWNKLDRKIKLLTVSNKTINREMSSYGSVFVVYIIEELSEINDINNQDSEQ